MAEERIFNIVCGHYGCGKSNFSMNLAITLAEKGRKVLLMDLDLVNPYFLSSGYKELLEKKGIQVLSPLYANTNVDVPALPPEMNLIFETDRDVILDVGGDDAGATVLGRFCTQISNLDYEFLYVINKYRNLTATVEDAVEILKEIEAASRLKATKIINNSHLKEETSFKIIEDSLEYAKGVAKETGLPLEGTTIPKHLLREDRVREEVEKREDIFIPIEIYVKAPWEME